MQDGLSGRICLGCDLERKAELDRSGPRWGFAKGRGSNSWRGSGRPCPKRRRELGKQFCIGNFGKRPGKSKFADQTIWLALRVGQAGQRDLFDGLTSSRRCPPPKSQGKKKMKENWRRAGSGGLRGSASSFNP